MKAVKTPRSPEVKYRLALEELVFKLRQSVAERVIPILQQYEHAYVRDGYAKTLQEAFENLSVILKATGSTVDLIASKFINEMDDTNKQRFYKALGNVVGVNMQAIVEKENLTEILTASTRENVALIKSIPEEYLKKVEMTVFRGTTKGLKATSMIEELRKIGHVTKSRAKLIARDQSSKINSALNQHRQENLGVEEYIWITSEDERVRPTHASKRNKVFRWDSPPADTGHPGNDIQCRCVAQPIIVL